MAITLADIERIYLRYMQPFFEEQMREAGVMLPTPWHPTDEELVDIANMFAQAIRECFGGHE